MKYKIILLRDESPELEKAINLQLEKDPNFLKSFSQNGGPLNHKIGIGNNWHSLTFLVIKASANVNTYVATDILLYADFNIRRPTTVVYELSLISFCNNIPFTLTALEEVAERLYKIYSVTNIGFTSSSDGTVAKLFDAVISNTKFAEKYFTNWTGRLVGYKTDHFTDQANRTKDLYMYELLRN